MLENYDPRIPVEDVTDAQVAEAIWYLDPDRCVTKRSARDDDVFVICFSLLVIVAGVVAYVLFYLRLVD